MVRSRLRTRVTVLLLEGASTLVVVAHLFLLHLLPRYQHLWRWICPAGWPKYLCPQPPAGFSADAFRDAFAKGEASPNGVADYFAERFEVADTLASPEKWYLTYQDTSGGMMPRRSGESTAEYQREVCAAWTFQRFVTVRNQPGVVCADQQYEVSVSWGGSEQVYTDPPANPTIDHGRVTVADATGTAAPFLYLSADLVAAINGWKPVKG